MSPQPPPALTRRAVLLGGAATLALAACGGSKDDDGADGGGGDDQASSSRSLVAFFGADTITTHAKQRLTFGIGDGTGALIKDGPKQLDLELVGDGSVMGRITAPRRDSGLPRAYYPFEVVLPAAGNYQVRGTIDGRKVDAAFSATDDVAIPQVGDAFPVLDTPTTDDARGVDPICTRDPQCPLHGVDLRDALGSGKPTVLLVSTPAYCQVGICGPVLDVLLAARKAAPADITYVHAEVYASGAKAAADIANAELAPVVQALHLPFEPCLFVIGADGTLRVRLDSIFDAVELREALNEAVA